MPDFTLHTLDYAPERDRMERMRNAAPEMYEALKEELIPTSDFGGTLSFSREAKVRKLLARIDGKEGLS